MEKIAIIGMAARIPGAASLPQFWDNVADGVDSIRRFSTEELLAAGVPKDAISDPQYVPANGYLDGVDLFDRAYFGLGSKEAELLDPQQRLFLECAVEALEHGNCVPDLIDGSVGVYAGSCQSTYRPVSLGNVQQANGFEKFNESLFNDRDYLATRVSYLLNLRGPAMTIQTACSTGLVAVHSAAMALRTFQCDVALAGAANIVLPQDRGYFYQSDLIYSNDGCCRPFSRDASGTVFANGVGVVCLKRLSDAVADGDRIEAVILSSACNNDGAGKVAFSAPGLGGQVELVALAHSLAQVPADSVSYVETHGTGTRLGDPIEIEALTRAFRFQTSRRQFCALGSVKANLGHLGAAAGMAGLIKTVLCLQHRRLPPMVHFRQPNESIDLESSPFYVPTECSDWNPEGGIRRAGVSSFGVGGTNAHLILEERPAADYVRSEGDRSPFVHLPLSARCEESLSRLAGRYLETDNASLLTDRLVETCYSAGTGRRHFEYRRVIAGRSASELREGLEALKDLGKTDSRKQTKLALVFPGHGPLWRWAQCEALLSYGAFRATFDQVEKAIGEGLGFSILESLRRTAVASPSLDTAVEQIVLTAVSVSINDLLVDWGIKADAILGVSLGELSASYASGAVSLEELILLMVKQYRAVSRLSNRSATLTLGLKLESVNESISGRSEIVVAGQYGSHLTSVVGPSEEVKTFEMWLNQERISYVQSDFGQPFHHPDLRGELGGPGSLSEIQLRQPSVPLYSAELGGLRSLTAERSPWLNIMAEPVRFDLAVQSMIRDGVDTVLEISPEPSLIAAVEDIAKQSDHQIGSVGLYQNRGDDQITGVGRLFELGFNVDWSKLFVGSVLHGELPSYPWRHQRYWVPSFSLSNPTSTRLEEEEKRETVVLSKSGHVGARSDDRLRTLWFASTGCGENEARQYDFFANGGDSLTAISLLTDIHSEFGVRIPLQTFQDDPTLGALEHILDRERKKVTPADAASPLVPVQPKGSLPPVFAVNPVTGVSFPYYALARAIGNDCPFYALQPPGLASGQKPLKSIRALARLFVDSIVDAGFQPPFYLCGWSFGALVAHAMSVEMEQRGIDPTQLVILDTPAGIQFEGRSFLQDCQFMFDPVTKHLWPYVVEFYRIATVKTNGSALEVGGLQRATDLLRRHGVLAKQSALLLRVFIAHLWALYRYRLEPVRTPVELIQTKHSLRHFGRDSDWGWGKVTSGKIHRHPIEGNHMTMMQKPVVADLGGHILQLVQNNTY